MILSSLLLGALTILSKQTVNALSFGSSLTRKDTNHRSASQFLSQKSRDRVAGDSFVGTTERGRRSVCVQLDNSKSEIEGESDNRKKEEAELNVERIAEMIEVSFVNACLQLAQGYVDVLKLFIVSTKAAYEKGLSISDLSLVLEQCPIQSAQRPLLPEEIDLRLTWISLIYLTLQTINYKTMNDSTNPGCTVSTQIRQKYETLVDNVMSQRQNNVTLKDLTIEGISDTENVMEKAILSQSSRLVYVTFTVLEDEEKCLSSHGGSSSSPPLPGPPIPGAF